MSLLSRRKEDDFELLSVFCVDYDDRDDDFDDFDDAGQCWSFPERRKRKIIIGSVFAKMWSFFSQSGVKDDDGG